MDIPGGHKGWSQEQVVHWLCKHFQLDLNGGAMVK